MEKRTMRDYVYLTPSVLRQQLAGQWEEPLAAAFAARGLEAQVTQIWAARSKGAGGLNLMMGQNPVWLISGRRREEEA